MTRGTHTHTHSQTHTHTRSLNDNQMLVVNLDTMLVTPDIMSGSIKQIQINVGPDQLDLTDDPPTSGPGFTTVNVSCVHTHTHTHTLHLAFSKAYNLLKVYWEGVAWVEPPTTSKLFGPALSHIKEKKQSLYTVYLLVNNTVSMRCILRLAMHIICRSSVLSQSAFDHIKENP